MPEKNFLNDTEVGEWGTNNVAEMSVFMLNGQLDLSFEKRVFRGFCDELNVHNLAFGSSAFTTCSNFIAKAMLPLSFSLPPINNCWSRRRVRFDSRGSANLRVGLLVDQRSEVVIAHGELNI